MLFSAEQYLSAAGKVEPLDLDMGDLQRIKHCLANGLCNSYTMRLGSRTDAAIDAYVQQLMKSGIFAPDTAFMSSNDLSHWKVNQNSAQLVNAVSYRIYQAVNRSEEITEKTFNANQYKLNCVILSSTTQSELPYPGIYRGEDVITHFRDCIETTAPYLPDLKGMEWRFESILLYNKEKINFALQELTKKGFSVSLSAPYIKVQNSELSTHQALCVRIPEEAEIAADAVHQEHSSYKSSLSVHNVLVAARDQDKQITLEVNGDASEALKAISKELQVLARKHPAVKQYAFQVEHLNRANQQELLARLKELGYQAKIESPFINQRFSGSPKSFYQQVYKQYMMIELP